VVLQPDSAKNRSDKKKELNKIKYCFFMQCLYLKLEYNIKKLELSLPFLPGFMDLGHACGRWSVITPVYQFSYFVFRPFCHDLHCTIRPIPDPTENTQRKGLSARGVPEPYPLNPAFNNKVYSYITHSRSSSVSVCTFPAKSGTESGIKGYEPLTPVEDLV
jgi:hypothetical protein